MAETGVLQPDARVELLDGEIIDMPPIGPEHGGSSNHLNDLFNELSKKRWLVSVQNSLRLNEHWAPQPDLVLLKRRADFYTKQLPTPGDVFLLVEVAETSLTTDRNKKLPAYGQAGVSEVWILNLVERKLEVYREPHFAGYASQLILRAGDRIAPAAFPDAVIEVADLVQTS